MISAEPLLSSSVLVRRSSKCAESVFEVPDTKLETISNDQKRKVPSIVVSKLEFRIVSDFEFRFTLWTVRREHPVEVNKVTGVE